MPSWKVGVGTLFLTSILLTGCGSDPGFTDDQFRATEGSVQFVNMMADSPQVRMFHGLTQDDVAFPFTSPEEIRFVDRYDWEIAYQNAANDRVTVAEGENQQISENVLSTFLFMGNTAQPNIQIVDTPVVPVAERPEGMADVWFAANMSQDMVDIYLIDSTASIADSAPLVTVTNGTFTQLFTVPSGDTRRLWVTLAGTDEVLFDSGELIIVGQTQELFALVRDFGPDNDAHVDVIRSRSQSRSVIQDFSQPLEVRSGNYSSFGALDVTASDVSFPSVSANSFSGYQRATNGTQPVTTSTAGTLLEETELPFFRGLFQSVVSFNDPDNPDQTRTVAVLDSGRSITDRAEFKFINGSGVTVDVYLLRDGQDTDEVPPFLNDVGFGGTTTREAFPENLRFVVTSADGAETLASLSQTLQNLGSYSLIFDSQNTIHLVSQ